MAIYIPFWTLNEEIQGYLPQRRLYKIYTVYFLILLCTCKLFFFVAMSINRPLKDNIQGRRLNLTLSSLLFFEFQVVITISSFEGNPVYEIFIQRNFHIVLSLRFKDKSTQKYLKNLVLSADVFNQGYLRTLWKRNTKPSNIDETHKFYV